MADTPTWTDIASTVTGFVGGAAGLAALAVAVWANRNSKDANRIARESNGKADASNTLAGEANTIALGSKDEAAKANDIATDAVGVSRDAAVSAQASADAALDALKMARVERHEALRPVLRGQMSTLPHTNPDSLFVDITVGRDYRVMAAVTSWNGNSSSPVSIDSVLHANREVTVFVEHFTPGQVDPKSESLKLRFWPPVAGDGVDVWSCGCGEPEVPDGGDGHWTKTIQLIHLPNPMGFHG